MITYSEYGKSEPAADRLTAASRSVPAVDESPLVVKVAPGFLGALRSIAWSLVCLALALLGIQIGIYWWIAANGGMR